MVYLLFLLWIVVMVFAAGKVAVAHYELKKSLKNNTSKTKAYYELTTPKV